MLQPTKSQCLIDDGLMNPIIKIIDQVWHYKKKKNTFSLQTNDWNACDLGFGLKVYQTIIRRLENLKTRK